MKKFLLAILTSLLTATALWSQGAAHTNVAYSYLSPSATHSVTFIPNATITVCPGTVLPTFGFTCGGGLASLFQNSTLTTALTNPFNADGNGNFTFYIAPGNYIVSMSALGFTTYSYPIKLACPSDGTCTFTGSVTFTSATFIGNLSFPGNNTFGGNNILSGNNSFSGTNTHTGPETFNQLNACQFVNAGQSFATALAAVTTPGCIEVTPGTYTVASNATIPAGVTLRSKSGGLLSIANTVTLTVNGPPDIANAQAFTYVGTGVVSFGNNAGPVNPVWFPGGTADIQLTNAINALPSGGGIVSCYNYGPSTQTIAATVTTGAATKPVFLACNRATTFVPSTNSTDMFAIAANSQTDGLTIVTTGVANYAGNAVKFIDTYADDQTTSLTNFLICNGTVLSSGPCHGGSLSGVGLGNGILMQAQTTPSNTFIAFVHLDHGHIIGFNNGLLLNSTGTAASNSFINANVFTDIEVSVANHCAKLQSNPGDLTGNKFFGLQCEFGGVSPPVDGWSISAGVGSNGNDNWCFGCSMFDMVTGQTGVVYGANTRNNYYYGSIHNNVGGTAFTDSGTTGTNNVTDSNNNQFGNDVPWNSTGSLLFNIPNGFGFKLKTPDTQWNIAPHTVAANDLCYTLSGVATEMCLTSTELYPANIALNLGKAANPWANMFIGTAATNNFKLNPVATAAARTVTINDTNGVATVALPLFGSAGTAGYQTKRVAGCATAASLNATCDTTVTWTTAFADANYTAVCVGDVVTSGIPIVQGIDISAAKTGASITVRTISITAAAAQFTTIDCTAQHD